MSDTLAARLTRALKARKVSQAALARACGITPPSVSDLVRGQSLAMKADTLLRASTHLRVNPRWLSEGIGPSGLDDDAAAAPKVAEPPAPAYCPPAPFSAATLAALRTLPPHELQRVEAMLVGLIDLVSATGLGESTTPPAPRKVGTR